MRHFDLLPRNYDDIRARMTATKPGLPSALDNMTGRELCLPHYHDHELPLHKYDTSFTRQINEVYSQESPEPDVVFGTVKSGIPPLDAVRGFLDARNMPHPLFLPMHVNQWFSFQYYSPDIFNVAAHYRGSVWAGKLKPVLAGANVLVIEEFVRTGHTLEVCGRIAQMAGAASVIGLRGRWYDNAYRQHIDMKSLSSKHVSFMRRIGQQAAAHTLQNISD